MKIIQLKIENYKSLRSVTVTPAQLSVIVGANSSGKSNFADCFDFISDVYTHGLEVAVSRKGGYENIAFRRDRRSKKAIAIDLCIEFAPKEISRIYFHRSMQSSQNFAIRVSHSFAFVTRSSSIRADFTVSQETFTVEREINGSWHQVFALKRDNKNMLIEEDESLKKLGDASESAEQLRRFDIFDFSDIAYFAERYVKDDNHSLLLTLVRRYQPLIQTMVNAVEEFRVFQISPTRSREYGVPTPRPELDRYGANLPTVIDAIKKDPKRWDAIMQSMSGILPNLTKIDVNYTSAKTLGLFFGEAGSGRTWSVDEVSDGTLQTLALLVAIYDPSSTLLVLEEMENSVHPWIIRRLLDACKDASETKQIILTTHSPIIMNAVSPENVWVMWRDEGASSLAQLTNLDPIFTELWKDGTVSTFEYLDSGAEARAIPPVTAI